MKIRLDSLNSNSGARRRKLRKGRGIAAGQGASCGFGMRGQKSRSGRPTRPGFEGGQMPLYRRLPKRGFKSLKIKNIALINLSRLQEILDKKNILDNNKINLQILQKSNYINKKYKKLKLLGDGEIKKKFDVEVNYISNSAKTKIEKLGGKVSLIK